ncbi:MAG TPA: amidohydrolase family protein [Candidatus Polarisedimenticolaceae bacterium]|nr:amidohydrolase family protein [Candidatus Polarisedimenticolaceae bacterium]
MRDAVIDGYRVCDVHVHIQPWEMHPPSVAAAMEHGRGDLGLIASFMAKPKAFLEHMDRSGIERAAIINYVAPDVMGFTAEVNDWCARWCGEAPDRLIAFGSVNPRFTDDPAGETERVLDLGIRALKIHPPHQLFQVNAYRTGGEGSGIGDVWRVAQERSVPVMIHTGTSIFPGARNTYADPLPADDVGVDFPKLKVILAHAGRPLHGRTAMFLVRRHPNFMLDLSGIPPKRMLDYVPRLTDLAGRCLWGSDWPSPGVEDLRRNVIDFLALDLPDDARRAILWENSARVFDSR